MQYTAHIPVELYTVTDRTKNHQQNTFTLSTSQPDYTKPATPISMLCFFVCLYQIFIF